MTTQASEKFSPIHERWRIIESIAPINPNDVINITSEYFSQKVTDIMSERRYEHLSLCRAIIYKILYRRTEMTQGEIGEMFNRDRTSVIHGIRALTGWMEIYPEIRNHFETIEKIVLEDETTY